MIVAVGYSQWELTRIIGVSQVCINKVLQCNLDTGQPHQRRSGVHRGLATAQKGRQLIRMVSIVNRLLVAGFRSRHPTRCIRLTLDHIWQRRVWGRMHRMWDPRHWVSRDVSHFMPSQSDGRAHVRRMQGERLIDAYIQPTVGNCCPSVMVWGAIRCGRSELVVFYGPLNCQCYIRLLCGKVLPWATNVFGKTLCISPNSMWHDILFSHNRMWRSLAGQLWVQTWTPLSMFGTKWGSGCETWMTPLPCAFLANRGGHTRY